MNQLVRMILARAARDPAFRDVVLNHPEQLLQDFPLTEQELEYLQQLSPSDLVGLNPQPEPPSSPPNTLDEAALNPQPEPPSAGPPMQHMISDLEFLQASGLDSESSLAEVRNGEPPEPLEHYDYPGGYADRFDGVEGSDGRVKVKFPWLPGEDEPSQPGPDDLGSIQPVDPAPIAIPNLIEARKGSNEAPPIEPEPNLLGPEPPLEGKPRMDGVVILHSSMPGGGSSAPESDGEVVIAFEQGDPHKPYAVGGLYGEPASHYEPEEEHRKPSRIPLAAFIGIIAVLLLLGLGAIGMLVGDNLRSGNDNAVENPPSDDGSFTPIPVGIGATAEDETAEPTGEPAGEGDTTGGSSGGATGGSTATCGDGVCDPASENSDLCPADCQCVDDGVCSPSEGAACRDCGSNAGACGSVCTESGQCAGGLSCAGGVCWDACTCGGDCATTGDGGSTGGSSGGSCPCSCTTVCDPVGGGCVTTCADCTGALCTP